MARSKARRKTPRRRQLRGPDSNAEIGDVGKLWGVEKVQHYRWAHAGPTYCRALNDAAIQNPDWKVASTKLNQLLLRAVIDQRPFTLSTNPIALVDLEQLRRWTGSDELQETGCHGLTIPFRPVLTPELPAGYSFDRYGLIVGQRREGLAEVEGPCLETCGASEQSCVRDGSMLPSVGMQPEGERRHGVSTLPYDEGNDIRLALSRSPSRPRTRSAAQKPVTGPPGRVFAAPAESAPGRTSIDGGSGMPSADGADPWKGLWPRQPEGDCTDGELGIEEARRPPAETEQDIQEQLLQQEREQQEREQEHSGKKRHSLPW